MMQNVTGTPVNDSNKYTDTSTVETYLRSFEFGANTNPTESQVQNIIERKTRHFERETPTAFRTLEVNDYIRKVNPTESQQSDEIGNHRAGNRTSRAPRITGSDTRHIEVRLPNVDIQSIDKLEVRTDANDDWETVSDPDEYNIYSNQGMLEIKSRQFRKTVTGRAGDNLFERARIRVSYTYGRTGYLEPDVEDAIAKLTVYDIVNSDSFGTILSEDEFFIDPEEYTKRIKQEADKTINKYRYGRN